MSKVGLFSAGLCMTIATGCTSEPDNSVGMANPASVHCIEKGGRLELRNEQNGAVGNCHLPDGRVFEEWEFFRSENKAYDRQPSLKSLKATSHD